MHCKRTYKYWAIYMYIHIHKYIYIYMHMYIYIYICTYNIYLGNR